MNVINEAAFQAFSQELSHRLQQRLDDRAKVSLQTVRKNNNVEMLGITIWERGRRIAPTIYLEPYYAEYMEGSTLEDVTERIIEVFETEKSGLEEDFCFEFQKQKDYITYRLVNRARNEEVLRESPHYILGSMALIFQCIVASKSQRLGTVRITNTHIRDWGVNREMLLVLAKKNTPRILPGKIRTMDEVILSILQQKAEQWEGTEQEEEWRQRISEAKQYSPTPMFLLSNSYNNYGAAAILNPAVVEPFAKELGEDFYILPSSVHEVILLPVSKAPAREEIGMMVREINESQVSELEYLTDDVYLYSELQEMVSQMRA